MAHVRFEDGAPVAWTPEVMNQEQHLPHGAASIPRSVFEDTDSTGGGYKGLSTVRKSRSLHSLNIDFPLDAQSSLSVSVSQEASPNLSDDSVDWSPSPDAVAVGDLLGPRAQRCNERQTGNHIEQDSHSPRKPIPSQWLLKGSAPRLATAQRARVREAKKDSSGSPAEHKSLRGTRSFHDTGKPHLVEGTTFLTKEALAAVENDLGSPTLRHSNSKQKQPKPKPSWNSPVQSPKHETLRKSAKSKLLSPTGDYKRASSNVTSGGVDSSPTTHNSAVRRLFDSHMSCTLNEGFFEVSRITDDDKYADRMDLQTTGDCAESSVKASKATSLRARSSRPQLFVNIPETPPDSDREPQSASTVASATSSLGMGDGLSPNSSSPVSRIPRPLTGSYVGDARGPTLSSSLKRAKSVASLTSPKAASHQVRSPTSRKTSSTRPSEIAPRHVRTLDSSGTTPILLYHPTANGKLAAHTSNEFTSPTGISLWKAEISSDHEGEAKSVSSDNADNDISYGQASRATSTSTVRATPIWDPVAVDSAVIYSRKKSDSLDPYTDNSTVACGQKADRRADESPVRGRSTEYTPMARKSTPSEMSIPSSLGSDLRATAPEFIPSRASTLTEDAISPQVDVAYSLPNMYSMDAYGLPWYYHMYPVPWSYPTGFYNNRSRSPKKFSPRKQRQHYSSPSRAQQYHYNASPSKVVPPVTPLSKQLRGQTPMFQKPVSPMTLLEQSKNTDLKTSTSTQPALSLSSVTQVASKDSVEATHAEGHSNTFVHQLDYVSRQVAAQGTTTSFRTQNIDLTTMHNIPVGQGHYYQHHRGSPSRQPGHRRGNNGLYDGRGVAGVPMSATAPFPSPMAPHGKPVQAEEPPTRYVGYTIGTNACGLVNIEVAAERGGAVCDSCDPDR